MKSASFFPYGGFILCLMLTCGACVTTKRSSQPSRLAKAIPPKDPYSYALAPHTFEEPGDTNLYLSAPGEPSPFSQGTDPWRNKDPLFGSRKSTMFDDKDLSTGSFSKLADSINPASREAGFKGKKRLPKARIALPKQHRPNKAAGKTATRFPPLGLKTPSPSER